MEDFENIVTLKVRTGKDESFVYDSRSYVVSVKKGLKVNRLMADLALKQNALRWDSSTGLVVEATVYVEEDANTEAEKPMTDLKPEEINAVKNTDGLGEDTILLDGKVVKKTTIEIPNKYNKKTFTENNQ